MPTSVSNQVNAFFHKHKEAIIIALLFLTATSLQLIALSQTPFGDGWDSYFYLVQIKSFYSEGHMHSNDRSLIYPLLFSFNFLFKDPVVTLKFVTALLTGCFSAALFWTSRKHGATILLALLLTTFTLFSPELTYFATQWPKNLLGAVLFVLLIGTLPTKQYWLIGLLLVAGFFGHRSTGILALVTATTWYIGAHLRPKYLLYAAGLLLMVLLVGIFIPGIISIYDTERFNDILNLQFDWAPISFYAAFGKEKVRIWWTVELIVFSTACIMLFIKTGISLIKKQAHPLLFCLCVITLICCFPLYDFDAGGVPYRLFHLCVLLTPLLSIPLLRKVKPSIVGVSSGVLLVSALFSWQSYIPEKHNPPYGFYQLLSDKLVILFKNPREQPELIIGHKAMAEYVTYTTGVDVLPWLPEYPIAKEKLWRIAVVPYEQLLYYYLDESQEASVHKLALDYYYIREDVWQVFIQKLKDNSEVELLNQIQTWQNPNKIRPQYLLKNKD